MSKYKPLNLLNNKGFWPEKAAIVEAFLARFGADLDAGKIRPVIHQVLPLADVPAAHRLLKASTHFGKLVLRVREEGL